MKKHFFIVSIFAGLFLSVFFVSCEKDESIENPDNSITEKSTLGYPYSAYFENLGDYHNSVLDFVGKNGDVSKLSRKDRFELAEEFTNSGNSWSDIEQEGDDIWQIVESNTSITTMLNNPPYSADAIGLVEELNSIFDNALKMAKNGNPLKPADFNSNVNGLIDSTYTNFSVTVDTIKDTGNDFAMVVGACFLAQATYEYWYNSALDSTSYWYGYLDNHTSKSLIGRIWKAIKVAAVDTWSFMTAPGCGSADLDGYDLICAGEYAGEQSSSVE